MYCEQYTAHQGSTDLPKQLILDFSLTFPVTMGLTLIPPQTRIPYKHHNPVHVYKLRMSICFAGS